MSPHLPVTLLTLAAAGFSDRAEPLPDGTAITVSAGSGSLSSRGGGHAADGSSTPATPPDTSGDTEFIHAEAAQDFTKDGPLRADDHAGADPRREPTLNLFFGESSGSAFDFGAAELASLAGRNVLAEAHEPWRLRPRLYGLYGMLPAGPFESIALQFSEPDPAPLA